MLDGMLANIYLRVTKDGRSRHTKLLGVDSPSELKISGNQMLYEGEFENVRYKVHFKLIGLNWFWKVRIEGEKGIFGEVFYGQDVSLNYPYANEAYVCQYLDHSVCLSDGAYHVRTKQNQGPAFILQQGSLTPNVAFATDGFDFFGKEYVGQKVKALELNLPSRVTSMNRLLAFQTRRGNFPEPYEALFYASLNLDWEANGLEWKSVKELQAIHDSVPDEHAYVAYPKIERAISFQDIYPYLPFDDSELKEMFPEKMFLEEEDGTILSWFSEKGTHYVTGTRKVFGASDANIITNRDEDPEIPGIANTNYIRGFQFSSHLGRRSTTAFRNKTPLNVLKTSGQRLS